MLGELGAGGLERGLVDLVLQHPVAGEAAGLDVGQDSGAAVSPDYGPTGNSFNGTIKGIALEIGEGEENSDHMVKPEQVLAAAMGQQ